MHVTVIYSPQITKLRVKHFNYITRQKILLEHGPLTQIVQVSIETKLKLIVKCFVNNNL